ncbi:hypothetical protein [Bradyrhizobium sp. S3.9.1]|uniref:hypothetical protein n=1 Tax=Bradyrhizobium sp. S3.9.1 TaxID=3156431 RepID=UPI003397ED39
MTRHNPATVSSEDMAWAVGRVTQQINTFAAELRARLVRDPVAVDRVVAAIVKAALSDAATIHAVVEAAIVHRAVAIAKSKPVDEPLLDKLRSRIAELDDGDMANLVTAFAACGVAP